MDSKSHSLCELSGGILEQSRTWLRAAVKCDDRVPARVQVALVADGLLVPRLCEAKNYRRRRTE